MEYKSGSSDGLPKEVRPETYTDGLDPTPTEWVTVLHHALDRRDLGISSYLTTHAGSEFALSKASWTHGDVGQASIAEYGDGRAVFQDGMADRTCRAEFFVQRRRHQQPQVEPTIEFTPSFLWYFAAVPRPDGSSYFLDEAGRDQELIRIRRTDTDLRIEVAALPLRRYLAARERFLVVQYDRVTHLDHIPEPRIDAVDRTPARHYVFHSGSIGSREEPGFVRLLGKHLVLPIQAQPADLGYPYSTDEHYPQFVIGVDPATGQHISFTCDPDRLSDHFTDQGTPHYLTRVYF